MEGSCRLELVPRDGGGGLLILRLLLLLLLIGLDLISDDVFLEAEKDSDLLRAEDDPAIGG